MEKLFRLRREIHASYLEDVFGFVLCVYVVPVHHPKVNNSIIVAYLFVCVIKECMAFIIVSKWLVKQALIVNFKMSTKWPGA